MSLAFLGWAWLAGAMWGLDSTWAPPGMVVVTVAMFVCFGVRYLIVWIEFLVPLPFATLGCRCRVLLHLQF